MALIRTALTLNIGDQEAQDRAFIANGTHLGYLSSSPQKTHVQTNHRPVQLIVSFKLPSSSEATEPSVPRIDRERPQRFLEKWKAFTDLLSKRGSQALDELLAQYQLSPLWLLCLDEKRFQAWLPEPLNLYLLRDGELRKVRPVSVQDPDNTAHFQEKLSFHSMRLKEADHFLVLPPQVQTFFSEGEMAAILGGLQQLPVKMGELMRTAKLRGMKGDATWVAWQVLRCEADQKLIDDRTFGQILVATIQEKLRSRPSKTQEMNSESTSESLGEASTEASARTKPNRKRKKRPRRFIWVGAFAILALIIVSIVLAVTTPWNRDGEDEETTPPSLIADTTAQPTATPSPSPIPEPTPEPEPILLVVTANRLNLREQPGADENRLHTLDQGDVLQQLSEPEDDWVHVLFGDDLEGYVFHSYVEVIPEPDEEDEDEDET